MFCIHVYDISGVLALAAAPYISYNTTATLLVFPLYNVIVVYRINEHVEEHVYKRVLVLYIVIALRCVHRPIVIPM